MAEPIKTIWKITLRLPACLTEQQAVSFADQFGETELTQTVLRENREQNADWLIEWYAENDNQKQYLELRIDTVKQAKPDLEILEQSSEQIENRNWLEYSYQQFDPFTVGSFFIYGSHYEGTVPDDKIGLQIDAATAFGSGEHGTTAGCLEALEALHSGGFLPFKILDMGTGSGILAIAARKLWSNAKITAVDIDEESVHVTNRHQTLNNINDITCFQSDGFGHKTLQDQMPFDLIIANILAGPLKDMATDLSESAAKIGKVILSGILDEQAESVLEKYTSCGLKPLKTINETEWVTVTLEKT